MKDWECVEVKHNKDVGKTIKEWEKNGWHLHTYSTAGSAGPMTSFINHYLLFEREIYLARFSIVPSFFVLYSIESREHKRTEYGFLCDIHTDVMYIHIRGYKEREEEEKD